MGPTGCHCDAGAGVMRASDGCDNNFFFPGYALQAWLLDPPFTAVQQLGYVVFSTAGASGSLRAATAAAVVAECGY